MIYLDDSGYPLSEGLDGGDSAVRAGILVMTNPEVSLSLIPYENKGMLTRHPEQFPWNNPNNFTRDQLMPMLAGLYARSQAGYFISGYYKDLLKRVFKTHAKRLFFSQSIDRDKPGSTKILYPHDFYKDSNPVPTTYRRRFNIETMTFEKTMPLKLKDDWSEYPIESRVFDYRDPLLPNHVWCLIKSSRTYWLYPLALIGIPFFLITLFAHANGNHNEENQMLAEAYIMGPWALKLYKLVNDRWEERSEYYWTQRNEIEYHEAIVKFMEKY